MFLCPYYIPLSFIYGFKKERYFTSQPLVYVQLHISATSLGDKVMTSTNIIGTLGGV